MLTGLQSPTTRDLLLEALAADFGLTTDAVLEMPHTLIGDTDALAEKVLLDTERCGVTYRIVQGAQMEAMAPLVKATAGC